MSKKVVTILSNDWHLKRNNIETLKDLTHQLCKLAIKLGVRRVFGLGDIIDSRKSQTLDVLKGFEEILDIFKSYDITLIAIPGNHCKTRYDSDDSFLDPYKHHPNFYLCSDISTVTVDNTDFILVPFWEEEILVEKLKTVKDNSIVLSHFGTSSSINNDGSLNHSPITVESLKRFKKVFLGHFHQTCELTKDIIHLPSIYQTNFGEDNNKGFTILYEDLSYEIVKSNFKEFVKVKIDLDKTDKKELDVLIKKFSKSDDNIRFEFLGSEKVLKSLKKELFTSNGIEVKTKVKEIEDSIKYSESDEIVSFTKNSILEEFKEFCAENELEEEVGLTYLTKKLDGKTGE